MSRGLAGSLAGLLVPERAASGGVPLRCASWGAVLVRFREVQARGRREARGRALPSRGFRPSVPRDVPAFHRFSVVRHRRSFHLPQAHRAAALGPFTACGRHHRPCPDRFTFPR